ncbi:MAG TPA: hypothetical protein VF454_05745, partial [Gemmatimonadales bacterium]
RAQPSIAIDGDAFRVILHPLPPGIVRFEARGELSQSGAGTEIRLSVLPDRRALLRMAVALALFVAFSIWRGEYFWALFAFVSTIGGALASMSFSRPYADATRMIVREAAGLAPKITFLESTYR